MGITNDELTDVIKVFQSAIKSGMEVYRLVSAAREKGVDTVEAGTALLEYAKQTPFMFRGDINDLSAFWDKKIMSFDEFARLEPKLCETVKTNYTWFAEKGYLKIDNVNQTISITKSGQEYIFKSDFIMLVIKTNIETNQLISGVLDLKQGEKDGVLEISKSGKSSALENELGKAGAYKAVDTKIQKRASSLLTEARNGKVFPMYLLGDKPGDYISILKDGELEQYSSGKLTKATKGSNDVGYTMDDIYEKAKSYKNPRISSSTDLIHFKDSTIGTSNEVMDFTSKNLAEKGAKTLAEKGTEKGVEAMGKVAGKAGVAATGVGLAVQVGYEVIKSGASLLNNMAIKK